MQPKKNIVDSTGIFTDENEVDEPKIIKCNSINYKLKEERLKSFQESMREEFSEKNKLIFKENLIIKETKGNSHEKIPHVKSHESNETHRKTKPSKDNHKGNHNEDSNRRKGRRKSRERSYSRTKPKSPDQKCIEIRPKKSDDIPKVSKPISPITLSEQVLEESFVASTVSNSGSLRNKSKFSENMKRLLSKNHDSSHENTSSTRENSSHIISPKITVCQQPKSEKTLDCDVVKTATSNPVFHESSDTSASPLILSVFSTSVTKVTNESESSVSCQEPIHKPSSVFNKISNISFKFTPKRMPASNIFSDITDEKLKSFKNPATKQFSPIVKETLVGSSENCDVATVTDAVNFNNPVLKIEPENIPSSNKKVETNVVKESLITLPTKSNMVSVKIEPSICSKHPAPANDDSDIPDTVGKKTFSLPTDGNKRELFDNVSTNSPQTSAHEVSIEINPISDLNIDYMSTEMSSTETDGKESVLPPFCVRKTESTNELTHSSLPQSPFMIDIALTTESKNSGKNYDRLVAKSVSKIEPDISMTLAPCICKTEPVESDTQDNMPVEISVIKGADNLHESTKGGLLKDYSCLVGVDDMVVEKDLQTDGTMSAFKVPLSTKKQKKTEKIVSGEDSDHECHHDNTNGIEIVMENALPQRTSDAVECNVDVDDNQRPSNPEVHHPKLGTVPSSMNSKLKFRSKRFRKSGRSRSKERSRSNELDPNISNSVFMLSKLSSNNESVNKPSLEKLEKISQYSQETRVSPRRKSSNNRDILPSDRCSGQKPFAHHSTGRIRISKNSKERSRSNDRKEHLMDQEKSGKYLKHQEGSKKDMVKEEGSRRPLENNLITQNQSNDQYESKKELKKHKESRRHSRDHRGSRKHSTDHRGSGKHLKDYRGSRNQSKDHRGSRKQSKDYQDSRKQSKDQRASRRHSNDQQRSRKQSKDRRESRKNTKDKHETRKHSKDKKESRKYMMDEPRPSEYSKNQSGFRNQSKDHSQSERKSEDELRSKIRLKDHSRSRKKSGNRSEMNEISTEYDMGQKGSKNEMKDQTKQTKHSKDRSRSNKNYNDRFQSRKVSKDRSQPRKRSKDRSRSIKLSKNRKQSRKYSKDRLRSINHSNYRSSSSKQSKDHRYSRHTVKRDRSSSVKHKTEINRKSPWIRLNSRGSNVMVESTKYSHQERRQSKDVTRLDETPSKPIRTRTSSSSSTSSWSSNTSSSSSSNSSSTSSSSSTARSSTAVIDSLTAKTRAIVPRDCSRLSLRPIITTLPVHPVFPIKHQLSPARLIVPQSPEHVLDFSDIVMPSDSYPTKSLDNRVNNISERVCVAPDLLTQVQVIKSGQDSPVKTDNAPLAPQVISVETPDPSNTKNMLLDHLATVAVDSQADNTELQLVDLITRLITRAVGARLDDSISLVSAVPPPSLPSGTSFMSDQLYAPYTNVFNHHLYYAPSTNQQDSVHYQVPHNGPYSLQPSGIMPVDLLDRNHFTMPPAFPSSLETTPAQVNVGLWYAPPDLYGESAFYEPTFARAPGPVLPKSAFSPVCKPTSPAPQDIVAFAGSPAGIDDDDTRTGHHDDHHNFGSENSFRSLDSHQGPEPHELSDKDDLSSCCEFEFDDAVGGPSASGDGVDAHETPLDPFERWPDAPRPQYEHIIETEVHQSALGKRFEYAYLKSTVCNCVPPNPDEVRLGKAACDEVCFNRRIKVECNHKCPVYELCTNRRFQDRVYTPFEPFHCASDKGWGIRATVPIVSGTFIIEYVGELIDFPEFLSRVRQKARNSHHFVMAIQKDLFIDAGLKGNWSRFVNHSCDPNTEIERWVVNGKTRIGFFAKKFIGALDEITIDYQFQQYGLLEQKCFCMAPNCTGVMGKVNEKLQDQIKSSHVRARHDLVQKITARAALRDISHVSDMITVIREDPPLDRDTFLGFLTVLLHTEAESCLRTFVECGGLKIVTNQLDSVAWDDWQFKLLFLRCLDHFKLKKRTLLGSGSLAVDIVEHWAQSARYTLVHSPDPPMMTELLDVMKENNGLEFPNQLQIPASTSDTVIRFKLTESDLPEDPAEHDITELALSIKRYFDDEKEKFYIPKLKLLHSESMADLSLNDSESKSKDSASRASSVQGDYVKSKKQKIRRKCTEAIQKLSKDEFRRLFSERHEKSIAAEKNPVTTNDSTPNVVTSDSDSPDARLAVKKLLSNVIIEEINRLKHSDKFLIMPAEFQNFDLDKILSDLNIVGHDGVISLMNQSIDENKTSSGSTYSNSSSKSLDDVSRSDLYAGNLGKKRIGLPPNWNSRRSESGRYYFYNTVTKKTQWDIPVYPWDAGEEDPMAYNFGNASQFPITRLDVQMMYEEYKKVYKQQKLDDRRRHRLERSIQRKLNLTAGEKNKIEFSKEVFRAVKSIVKPYNSSACRIGRIQHKQDLKFLCEKFADTIISKEVKLVANLEDLEINANVRSKIKTYIEKYMANQGKCFKRSTKTKPKCKPTAAAVEDSRQESVEDHLTGTSHNTDSNNVPTVSDSVRTLNSPDFSP